MSGCNFYYANFDLHPPHSVVNGIGTILFASSSESGVNLFDSL